VLREILQLLKWHDHTACQSNRLRWIALVWTSLGALVVLLVSFVTQYFSGDPKPPGLTKLLIPANLFTGVLSCGIICLLNPWMDRVLPAQLRPGLVLLSLNLFAGTSFLVLGIKGYWDLGGLRALTILAGTMATGCVVALLLRPMIVASSDP
jgi:hypothetical protein